MIMKIGVIVQARMGSTRLPGKVARKISGKPMLGHIIERLKEADELDQIIVATSDKEEDNKIVKIAEGENVTNFRGSEEDVLSRYIEAAERYKLDVVLRVTGDCPLIDPVTIDELILEFLRSDDIDYMRLEGYPRGLDTGICYLDTLKRVAVEIRGDNDEGLYREHVTLYIYRNPEKFNIGIKEAPVELKRDYRLCVDEIDDYELINEIYKRLYEDGGIIDIREVIDLLDENPSLARINSNIEQKILD